MPNCGVIDGKSFHVPTGLDDPSYACLCRGEVVGPKDPGYRDPNIELSHADALALYSLAKKAGYLELAARLHDHALRTTP